MFRQTMGRIWIYIALMSICVGIEALQDDGEAFPDYWQNDEDYEWYSDEMEKLGIISTEAKDLSKEVERGTTPKAQNVDMDQDSDQKVVEEIEKFRNDIEQQLDSENKKAEDNLIDYQIEDNRSKVDDEEEFVRESLENQEKLSENDKVDLQSLDDLAEDIADLNRIKESLEEEIGETNPIKTFDKDTEDIAQNKDNLNKNETNDLDKIFSETKNILKEDVKDDFLQVQPSSNEQPNLDDIVKETKQILEETGDKLEENAKKSKSVEEENLEFEKGMNLDKDELKSLYEAYDDLVMNWDKLSEEWDENDRESLPTNDDEVLYKKYKDMTDDYENFDDVSIETLFPAISIKDTIPDKTDGEISQEEPSPDDSRPEEEKNHTESHVIEYLHDALEASDGIKNPDAEMITQTSKSDLGGDEVTTEIIKSGENIESNSTPESNSFLDHLSASEYDAAMDQFRAQHKDELNVKSEAFDKHVAPVHITIGLEPVVVTSPNYPSTYPTNNIVDWIFYGDGEGIEFNVTDFAVNGYLGDYLLVKPGGVDASGNEGLVFSYTLTSKRQYRFMDVNQMFVRFVANPGMQFMRGFSFSVKLIRKTSDTETEANPEPVRDLPHSTITLNLGGVTLEDFVDKDIEEEFRRIVADMATVYINNNDIDPGLNTTLEVTQVVSRGYCYHNWPKFENCVEVEFGVPLEYDDETNQRLSVEDLNSMWMTYVDQDPFASRLRRLGIMEYQVPNDRGVMMVWLVIAVGVGISMAMLAFALWRFSCFEDYTRMPAFSDTDSVKEKRNLDLYPTPHQTLPPLYSENEYKWVDSKYEDSTRVDIGGYANKNYVRDDLYDFDSDEDVVAARDSNKNIRPSDIYV